MDRKFSHLIEPTVSIVMSVYNSENYLKEAIDSILNQTYNNYEFIIIDDASTDSSLDIVKSYNDKRIVLIINEVNIGLAASLNKGIGMAKGKYIARMDSDDISKNYRIYEQVKYLETHQDVLCYGSWARYFGDNMPRSLRLKHSLHLYDTFRVPLKHEDIKASLIFWTPFVHPTVMFNTQLLKKYNLLYNPSYRKAQDYELWSRLCFVGKCANTSKQLLNYRLTSGSAGAKSHIEQQNARKTVVKNIIRKIIGRDPKEQELDIHIRVIEREPFNEQEFSSVRNWFSLLATNAKNVTGFDSNSLIRAISLEWRKCCASTFLFPRNILEYKKIRSIGVLKLCSLYDWVMFLIYKLK